MSIHQLEKVRAAYHKSCLKEQTALDKEKQANEDSEMSPEKKQKITDAREKVTEEKEKVRREVNTMQKLTPGHACCGLRASFTARLNSQFLIHVTDLNMLHSNYVLLACCMW